MSFEKKNNMNKNISTWRPWQCSSSESSNKPSLCKPCFVLTPDPVVSSPDVWTPPQPPLSPISSSDDETEVSKQPSLSQETPQVMLKSKNNSSRFKRLLPFTANTAKEPVLSLPTTPDSPVPSTSSISPVTDSSSSVAVPNRTRTLSKDLRLKIQRLYWELEVQKGHLTVDERVQEVANILKICRSSVYKYRKGLSPKQRGRSRTVPSPRPQTPISKKKGKKWKKNKAGPNVVRAAWRMSQSGLSTSSIADHLSLKRRHVRSLLQRVRQNGLPSPSVSTKPKQKRLSRSFKHMDSFFEDLIKRKLDNSYSKNIVPTLTAFLYQLIEDTRGSPKPFPYKSRKTLSLILKSLGYKLKKIER